MNDGFDRFVLGRCDLAGFSRERQPGGKAHPDQHQGHQWQAKRPGGRDSYEKNGLKNDSRRIEITGISRSLPPRDKYFRRGSRQWSSSAAAPLPDWPAAARLSSFL